MKRTELSLAYTSGQSPAATISAKIVQEEIPANTASLGDLNQMIARAVAHRSARSYMIDCCPAAGLKGDVLTVSLDILVYPSKMDLEYSVTADWGKISGPVRIRRPRRFDIIFDGTDSAELDTKFYGTFIPAMPFFDLSGLRIRTPEMTRSGFRISLSTPAYGVLRAIGAEVGYRHTVTMPLTIKAGTKVSDIKNHVTLTYIDSAGKIAVKQLLLEIPSCVKALLAICDGTGQPKLDIQVNPPDQLAPTVYYSDCDGHVIEVRYEAE